MIDSIDWLERLMSHHVALQGGHDSIADFGYNKGWSIHMPNEFTSFLSLLDELRDKRGMAIILVAHAQVVPFNDPRTDTWDRYEIDLHKNTRPIAQEWADIVGFCAREVSVIKEDKGFGKTSNRGVAAGGHMLHLQPTPAYDAKCRYANMPDKVPLNWSAFADAMTSAAKEPVEF